MKRTHSSLLLHNRRVFRRPFEPRGRGLLLRRSTRVQHGQRDRDRLLDPGQPAAVVAPGLQAIEITQDGDQVIVVFAAAVGIEERLEEDISPGRARCRRGRSGATRPAWPGPPRRTARDPSSRSTRPRRGGTTPPASSAHRRPVAGSTGDHFRQDVLEGAAGVGKNSPAGRDIQFHAGVDHRALVEHAASRTIVVMPPDRGCRPPRMGEEIRQAIPAAGVVDPQPSRGPVIAVQPADERLPLVLGDERAGPALVHEAVDVVAQLDDPVLLGLVEMRPSRAAQPVDRDAGDDLAGPFPLDVIGGADVQPDVVTDGAVLARRIPGTGTSRDRPIRGARRRSRSASWPCRGSSRRSPRPFRWHRTSRGPAVCRPCPGRGPRGRPG